MKVIFQKGLFLKKQLQLFKIREDQGHIEDIFNYFDATDIPHRSNGPVEQWNREIKAAHNEGRGYDYDMLRFKILFGSGKVKLNEYHEFVPANESNPYCEFIKTFNLTSFDFCDHMKERFLTTPYRMNLILSKAAKKDRNAARVYRYIKMALKKKSTQVGWNMVCETIGSCKKSLLEAATELQGEYIQQRSYIRYGVSFEEIHDKATLIHQQIADGLEGEGVLVNVETEAAEDKDE